MHLGLLIYICKILIVDGFNHPKPLSKFEVANSSCLKVIDKKLFLKALVGPKMAKQLNNRASHVAHKALIRLWIYLHDNNIFKSSVSSFSNCKGCTTYKAANKTFH